MEAYEENRPYIDEDSQAAIESLPGGAWETLCRALDEVGEDEVANPGCVPGIDCEVAVTQETFAPGLCARGVWHECTGRKSYTIDERRVTYFVGVQVVKGQRRVELAVVDFGNVRAVMTW